MGATTGKPLGLSDVERLERDLWFSPRGQETVTQVAKFGAHQATLLRFNGPATSHHPELEGSRLPRIELSEYPDRLDNCKIEYRASAIFFGLPSDSSSYQRVCEKKIGLNFATAIRMQCLQRRPRASTAREALPTPGFPDPLLHRLDSGARGQTHAPRTSAEPSQMWASPFGAARDLGPEFSLQRLPAGGVLPSDGTLDELRSKLAGIRPAHSPLCQSTAQRITPPCTDRLRNKSIPRQLAVLCSGIPGPSDLVRCRPREKHRAQPSSSRMEVSGRC